MFRDIQIKDVIGEGAPVAIRLTGLDDSLIEDISFENMTIASTQGVKLSPVRNATFQHVIVNPKTGPVFDLDDARGVLIANGRAPAGTTVFLQVAGRESRDIRLEAIDLAAAAQPVVRADGVAAEAVSVR